MYAPHLSSDPEVSSFEEKRTYLGGCCGGGYSSWYVYTSQGLPGRDSWMGWASVLSLPGSPDSRVSVGSRAQAGSQVGSQRCCWVQQRTRKRGEARVSCFLMPGYFGQATRWRNVPSWLYDGDIQQNKSKSSKSPVVGVEKTVLLEKYNLILSFGFQKCKQPFLKAG